MRKEIDISHKQEFTILNNDVIYELKNNPHLALAFYMVHDDYQWDIEPIHNPDHREKLMQIEMQNLNAVKEVLSRIWNTVEPNHSKENCMGMYNEVFLVCPKCEKSAKAQIPQVTLGFGEYYLDNAQSLMELTESELYRLSELLKEAIFECECGNRFQFDQKRKDKQKREKIKALFGI